MTAISSEIRPSRIVDSSSYRGGICGRYIEGGLSRSPDRKGLCTRV